MKHFRLSGKDVFSCRAQLKADGFIFDGASWFGSENDVTKFQSRGFRVKIYFTEQAEENEGVDA